MGTVTETLTTGTSWLCPVGVTTIQIECWGGGGKGGSRTTNGVGGGGAGGAYAKETAFATTPGTSYTYQIGQGATTTAAGTDTFFNSSGTVNAKGGASVADNTATGATHVTGSTGDTTHEGGDGGTGSGTNAGGGGESAGASANGNNGGVPAGGTGLADGGDGGAGKSSSQGAGSPGVAPGGAGGGAYRTSGSTKAGGNGANGQIILTYDLDNITTLTDDFEDGSLDSTKWETGNLLKNAAITDATYAESSGKGRISLTTTAYTNHSWGIISKKRFDWNNNNGAYVKLPPSMASIAAWGAFNMAVTQTNAETSFGDGVHAGTEYSNVKFNKTISGTETNIASVAYNSTNHGWLRIRCDGSNWIAETAPGSEDPPSTWTNLGTVAISSFPTLANAKTGKVGIEAEVFGTPSAAQEWFAFDGFNIRTAPAGTTISITAATINYAEQSVTLKQNVIVTAGTINYAEQSIGLKTTLSVTAANLAYSGQSITVLAATTIPITAGIVAYSGQAAAVNARLNIPVTVQTVTYSGQSVNLNAKTALEVLPAVMQYFGRPLILGGGAPAPRQLLNHYKIGQRIGF